MLNPVKQVSPYLTLYYLLSTFIYNLHEEVWWWGTTPSRTPGSTEVKTREPTKGGMPIFKAEGGWEKIYYLYLETGCSS